jgi:hypothetical protein
MEDVVNTVPQLKRGQVWCHTCGNTQRVDSGKALQSGWPKCCGYTMSIDSPEEREALADLAKMQKTRTALKDADNG